MPETFIKQTQDDIGYCNTLLHNYYNYVQFSPCIPANLQIKCSLILGAIFLFYFQKCSWFIILTIIDDFKSLLFFVLFITV